MAPEQPGQTSSVDHRADIYAVGVVFYEMLTEQLPVGRFAPPSRKVSVDVRLDEVVLRSLENEPERRYQSAREMITDVGAITVANSANTAPHPEKAAGASGRWTDGKGITPGSRTTPSASSPDGTRVAFDQLRLPALGLILGVLLNLLALPLLVWLDRSPAPATIHTGHGTSMNLGTRGVVPGNEDLLLLVFLISAIAGILLAFGALWMLMLDSRRSALSTCILGMLPVHPGFVLCFPLVWSEFSRLTRPEFAAGFTGNERRLHTVIFTTCLLLLTGLLVAGSAIYNLRRGRLPEVNWFPDSSFLIDAGAITDSHSTANR